MVAVLGCLEKISLYKKLWVYVHFIHFLAVMQLVAGSGNTDSSNDGKPAEVSAGGGGQVEKDDGYQAGIPGPITRLFIIANRGIANLVQDLILVSAENSTFTSDSCLNYITCLSFLLIFTNPQPRESQHIPYQLSIPSCWFPKRASMYCFSLFSLTDWLYDATA